MIAVISEPFGNVSCSLVTLSRAVAAHVAILFQIMTYSSHVYSLWPEVLLNHFIVSAGLMIASLTINSILSLILVKARTLENLGYTYYRQVPIFFKTRKKTSGNSLGHETRDAKEFASFRRDHATRWEQENSSGPVAILAKVVIEAQSLQ